MCHDTPTEEMTLCGALQEEVTSVQQSGLDPLPKISRSRAGGSVVTPLESRACEEVWAMILPGSISFPWLFLNAHTAAPNPVSQQIS